MPVFVLAVEFILGMNGATMGTLICYIFPALFFVRVMANKAEGKHIAQVCTRSDWPCVCLQVVTCFLVTELVRYDAAAFLEVER